MRLTMDLDRLAFPLVLLAPAVHRPGVLHGEAAPWHALPIEGALDPKDGALHQGDELTVPGRRQSDHLSHGGFLPSVLPLNIRPLSDGSVASCIPALSRGLS